MLEKVIKRDGREEAFDSSKIEKAIRKCLEASNRTLTDTVLNNIVTTISDIKQETVSVEDIQNLIVKQLSTINGYLANRYQQYRIERSKIRDLNINGKYYKTILELTEGISNEVSTENGNKDATQFNVMRDLIAGETCKKLYKSTIMSPYINELHSKGIIHVHDTDYRLMKGVTNCFSGDTKFITSEGVVAFKELKEGTIVKVPTHTGKWQRAVVHKYGKQDLYEYTISKINRPGYGLKVKATENHRWFLSSGAQTTNLQVGDTLLTKNDLIQECSLKDILEDPELVKYWCYGFILGDGSTIDIPYMYTHGLGKRKKSNKAKHLFITKTRLCGDKIKYLPYFLKANMKQYPIKNSNDILIVDYLFNKKEFLKEKHYTKLNYLQLGALIKGLICADGKNKYQHPLLQEEIAKCVGSANKEIQEIIERYSALAGYFISRTIVTNKDTNYGKRNYPLYEYTFVNQLPKKIISSRGKETFVTVPYKVLDKQYIGKEEVWCLNVEEDHSFILGNGLITGNCELLNLEDVLQHGTVLNGKRINKPHSLRTATTITTQVMLGVSSLTYGGMSITLAHLAPFVRISKSNYETYLSSFPYISKADKEKMIKEMLQKEISDSMQTLLYQLNSMTSSNGQSPFCTIFCYIHEDEDYIEENCMLIEELLKQRIKGMEGPTGQNINPAFPKIIYVLDEDNIEPNTKYFWLTKLAAECTCKRMVPDYISAKIMKKYKEGNVFPSMGCRSFLHPWKDANGNYKFYGRCNVGVISINLPYLALNSKNYEDFLNSLDEIIDTVSSEQYKVYQTISATSTDVAPLLWNYGVLARAPRGSKIGDVIKGGYCSASIGYMGISECVYHFGKEYPTKEGQQLGLDIIKHMYDRANYNKEKYGLALSLYGSPAESTTTTFAKALKQFPQEYMVNDRDYITNSYHIPVTSPIDGYSKIEFEAPFQEYSSGGAISYCELPDVRNNPEAILNILKCIYDNMMYCELNTTSCDVCYTCGYEGEIHMDAEGKLSCPNCGEDNPHQLYAIRRLCGYIGVLTNGISKGRIGDINDRVKHF